MLPGLTPFLSGSEGPPLSAMITGATDWTNSGSFAGFANLSSVVSGGTGPYSYAWSDLNADPQITFTTPTSASTRVDTTNRNDAAFIGLLVTDALGQSVSAAPRTINGSFG